MALIQIDSNNAIKSDDRSWMCCRASHRIDQKTKRRFVAWQPCSYHSSLGDAVRSLIDREIRCSEAETISELAVDIAAITSRICLTLLENLGIDDLQTIARTPVLRRQFEKINSERKDPTP